MAAGARTLAGTARRFNHEDAHFPPPDGLITPGFQDEDHEQGLPPPATPPPAAATSALIGPKPGSTRLRITRIVFAESYT
jgi:hypothetical protein